MAQGLNSGYFVEEYKFRHNMNPAFGNEQNYVSLPALGNINVRTQGNFGLGDVLFDNPRYGVDSDKKKTTFMNPYISTSDALSGFASGTNRINADVDITLLSAGFKAFGPVTPAFVPSPPLRRTYSRKVHASHSPARWPRRSLWRLSSETDHDDPKNIYDAS